MAKKTNYNDEQTNLIADDKKIPFSVFDFSDNSKGLIDSGIGWDHPKFPNLYKTYLRLSESQELPHQE